MFLKSWVNHIFVRARGHWWSLLDQHFFANELKEKCHLAEDGDRSLQRERHEGESIRGNAAVNLSRSKIGRQKQKSAAGGNVLQ